MAFNSIGPTYPNKHYAFCIWYIDSLKKLVCQKNIARCQMLKQLAKASRKKRDGPSLSHFKRTGKLLKRRRTPNASYVAHAFPSLAHATRVFRKLQRCVKKHTCVVEKHAHRYRSCATYTHYVVQHGKHRFHDDVELVLHGRTVLIRSSSREGVYDMGVNSGRVQKIERCVWGAANISSYK